MYSLSHICIYSPNFNKLIEFYLNIFKTGIVHKFVNDKNEMYGAFIEIGNNTLIEIFNSDLKLNQKEIPNYGWAISSYGEHYGGANASYNQKTYEKYPLYKYFDEAISAHDFNYIKEDIQFWYLLRNYLNIDYNETILVEDTMTNIQSARHSKLRSLYVTHSEYSEDEWVKPIECFSKFIPCLD